jgi:hypothetical protein
MSSATSIDAASTHGAGVSSGARDDGRSGSRGSGDAGDGPQSPAPDPTLHPWQFFVLAGMLSATGVVLVTTGQPPIAVIILSLTVLAASFVAVGAYQALAPLVRPASAEPLPLVGGRTRAGLEREKVLALRAIKELEFDFAMGKITKADFDELGARLRARALRLMRQLDANTSYKTAIEQELASRLATAGIAAQPSGGEPPRATSEVAEPGCPSCGEPHDADARFCKHCGTRLSGT